LFDALYLSPHLDDVVLSCGAQIWDRVQRGERVLVPTLFAAPPPHREGLSPFAYSLHQRWSEIGEFDREREDINALDRLRALPHHLNYPDCIYRRSPIGTWLYQSEEAIFGEVSKHDWSLIAEIAVVLDRIEVRPGAAIFVPRAIGNHVDHQIARAAGEGWCRARGRPFQYYADYPYAETAPGGEEIQVSEEGRRQKIEAIRAYRSQLSTFWPDEASMVTKVSQWAERTFQRLEKSY
jgi:LmbE family N-acetylglucosaminyl deacetylase